MERQSLNCQNDNSGIFQITTQELSKAQGNNTDKNNIEFSDTNPFLSSEKSGKEDEGREKYGEYYNYFFEQLEFNVLYWQYPNDREMLDSILELIIETMCSNRKMIRIASDDKPTEIVRSRFMKLNTEHIGFVMKCIKENTTKVRNIKQYKQHK